MNTRRPLVLFLSALLIAVATACSGGSNGDGTSNDRSVIPRETLQALLKTAEAAGTGVAPQVNESDPTETPIPLSSLSGEFEVDFRSRSEVTDRDVREALEMPDNLDILIGEGTIAIAGRAPFITVTGSLSPDGAISATGAGTIETYGELTASFEGSLVDAVLTGTYTITGLPDGAVVFDVEGAFD